VRLPRRSGQGPEPRSGLSAALAGRAAVCQDPVVPVGQVSGISGRGLNSLVGANSGLRLQFCPQRSVHSFSGPMVVQPGVPRSSHLVHTGSCCRARCRVTSAPSRPPELRASCQPCSDPRGGFRAHTHTHTVPCCKRGWGLEQAGGIAPDLGLGFENGTAVFSNLGSWVVRLGRRSTRIG
jgi:hypothetical protein